MIVLLNYCSYKPTPLIFQKYMNNIIVDTTKDTFFQIIYKYKGIKLGLKGRSSSYKMRVFQLFPQFLSLFSFSFFFPYVYMRNVWENGKTVCKLVI